MDKKNIVILGGGFAGVYTAMYLSKLLKRRMDNFQIIIISKENYFVYQPMLAEIVGGSLSPLDTVSALNNLLPKVITFIREIDHVDKKNRKIRLVPRLSSQKALEVSFDYLVVALGNVTDLRMMKGLYEHAFPFKNLADTLEIRNHIIETIQTATIIKSRISESTEGQFYKDLYHHLLTYVVVGGGFSGVEIVAELQDLVVTLIKENPLVSIDDVKVILIHKNERLMDREMPPTLSKYAEDILKKNRIDVRLNTELTSATKLGANIKNGDKVFTRTIISTVPSTVNPVIQSAGFTMAGKRIKTNSGLQVENEDIVWALGDCASVPDLTQEGRTCPPTAQYAVRQAKTVAQNIVAKIDNTSPKEFKFKCLGMLAALGHNKAIAEIFGMIRLSGLIAFLMWRAIYWMKLPGIGRRIKVLLSWILDTIFPSETIQLNLTQSKGIASLHFEAGEDIFQEGDIGDFLYIIVQGKVSVIKNVDGQEKQVAELQKGEFFGEMSLVEDKKRTATVRALESLDLLAIKKSDFGLLLDNFSLMQKQVAEVQGRRK